MLINQAIKKVKKFISNKKNNSSKYTGIEVITLKEKVRSNLKSRLTAIEKYPFKEFKPTYSLGYDLLAIDHNYKSGRSYKKKSRFKKRVAFKINERSNLTTKKLIKDLTTFLELKGLGLQLELVNSFSSLGYFLIIIELKRSG